MFLKMFFNLQINVFNIYDVNTHLPWNHETITKAKSLNCETTTYRAYKDYIHKKNYTSTLCQPGSSEWVGFNVPPNTV